MAHMGSTCIIRPYNKGRCFFLRVIRREVNFPIKLCIQFRPFRTFRRFQRSKRRTSFKCIISRCSHVIRYFLIQTIFRFLRVDQRRYYMREERSTKDRSNAINGLLRLSPIVTRVFCPTMRFARIIRIILVCYFVLRGGCGHITFPLRRYCVGVTLWSISLWCVWVVGVRIFDGVPMAYRICFYDHGRGSDVL